MKNVRLLLSCLALLLVGLLALALPGTAAAAAAAGDFVVVDDGDTAQPTSSAIDIPGILTILLGAAGAQQPGALTLGPIQLDVPTVNATAAVSGLSYGRNGVGWDAITLSQKEPQTAGAVTISGAQASIGGPSTRYSSDLSAHLAVQPSEAVKAEGTLSVNYDGMTGQTTAGLSDFGLAVDTPSVNAQVAGATNAATGLSFDTLAIDLPGTPVSADFSGLNITSAGPDWDTITVTQTEPQTAGPVTISGAQASVGGPSARYSSDLSAHVAVQPSAAVKAEGTLSVNYDGMTGQTTAGLSDFGLAVDTPSVNAQVAGTTDPATGVALDTLAIGLPGAGADTELTGFTITSAGPDWDALTVSRDDVKLGEAVTISDLQLTVGGPSASFASQASAQVALALGDLAYAGGQVEAVYDPATGQVNLLLSDGNAWVKTNALSIELQGIHTGDSGTTVDTLLITSPPIGLEVTMNGVTVGGTGGLDFQEARVKVTPAGGGPSKGFETVITNSGGTYTVTTTSTFMLGSGS